MLGFYLLIGVGPSLATTIYSVTDATGVRGIPISWVGLDNYDEFLFQGARSRDNLDVGGQFELTVSTPGMLSRDHSTQGRLT